MLLSPALEEHLEVLRRVADNGWKQSLAGTLKPDRNTDSWQHMLDELRFFTSQLRRM